MVCAGAIFASRAGAGRRAYRVIRSSPATKPRAKIARPMRVAFSRTPGSLRRPDQCGCTALAESNRSAQSARADVPASTFVPRLPDRRARTATQTDSSQSQPALKPFPILTDVKTDYPRQFVLSRRMLWLGRIVYQVLVRNREIVRP